MPHYSCTRDDDQPILTIFSTMEYTGLSELTEVFCGKRNIRKLTSIEEKKNWTKL